MYHYIFHSLFIPPFSFLFVHSHPSLVYIKIFSILFYLTHSGFCYIYLYISILLYLFYILLFVVIYLIYFCLLKINILMLKVKCRNITTKGSFCTLLLIFQLSYVLYLYSLKTPSDFFLSFTFKKQIYFKELERKISTIPLEQVCWLEILLLFYFIFFIKLYSQRTFFSQHSILVKVIFIFIY